MSEPSKPAGAPEIEITPEIIRAMEEAFRNWHGANDRAIHDGDTGDVIQLFDMLRTAMAKASISSPEAPKFL
jgi:hypothetical protein